MPTYKFLSKHLQKHLYHYRPIVAYFSPTLTHCPLFTALLFFFSALMQMFLPWWVSGLLCFIMALGWDKPAGDTFVKCGISQGALWALIMIYQDAANQSILSTRMADMLGLGHPYLLICVATLLIFITAGLSGMAGALLRDAFYPKHPTPPHQPHHGAAN